jgi:hypothetical protein
MHVEPPCEQGVASTNRTWGATNGRLTGIQSVRSQAQPSAAGPSLSLAMSLTTILTTIRVVATERPNLKENWTSGTFVDTLPITGGQRAMSSKPRQPGQAAAVHAGPGVAQAREERDAMIELIGATCSLHEENPQFGYLRSFCTRACVWARFRRDPAGDSLEVVHDQRPPTPFHAQNRQFQSPPTTANDTWVVRALLLILSFADAPDSRVDPGVRASRRGLDCLAGKAGALFLTVNVNRPILS